MAIIKCPECGHAVSDQAKSCPNCGFTINENKKGDNESYSPIATIAICVCFTICVVAFMAAVAFVAYIQSK